MPHTTTGRTHHRLMTSIVVAALLLTAGCAPGAGPAKPPPMRAIVGGGTETDKFLGVAVAADGGIVAVGGASSTDGDFPPGNGRDDALIANYSPDGTKQWAKTTGGSDVDVFRDVAVASDGSIIAVGYTASADGGFPPSHGQRDALIVKYDPDGTQAWAKTTGGSGPDSFWGVAVAGDGSIIAVGDTESTDGDFPPSQGKSDALIVKYDPDGTQTLAKTTGGSNDDGFWGVAVASDGGIIAVGYAHSTDGDFPPSQGKSDALIVKYDPDGTRQWAITSGGTDSDYFASVAVAGDGSIIAGGYTYSTDGDFPPSHGKSDALMARYGPDGTPAWATTTGGDGNDVFSGVALASDGSIIAAGQTLSTNGDFPPTHGESDALIVNYGPYATQAWAKTLGGTDSDYFIHVTVASDGSIIAAGWTASTGGDFPPTHGKEDALIVVLSPDA